MTNSLSLCHRSSPPPNKTIRSKVFQLIWTVYLCHFISSLAFVNSYSLFYFAFFRQGPLLWCYVPTTSRFTIGPVFTRSSLILASKYFVVLEYLVSSNLHITTSNCELLKYVVFISSRYISSHFTHRFINKITISSKIAKNNIWTKFNLMFRLLDVWLARQVPQLLLAFYIRITTIRNYLSQSQIMLGWHRSLTLAENPFPFREWNQRCIL